MKRLGILCLTAIASCCSPSSPANVYQTESGIEYKVRVDFVLPIEYKTQYPFIARAFEDAARTWAEVIPIDVRLIPKRTSDPTAIDIIIAPNIVIGGYYAPDRYLGLYYPPARSVFLSSRLLTSYDKAYSVALHELGHVFGLRHVIDLLGDGYGGTGDTVISLHAELSLMYPVYTEENEGSTLSKFDIELAREYVRIFRLK